MLSCRHPHGPVCMAHASLPLIRALITTPLDCLALRNEVYTEVLLYCEMSIMMWDICVHAHAAK